MLTSNGALNPIRPGSPGCSRSRPTSGRVSRSAGVTASYDAEASREVYRRAAPTLAQPVIDCAMGRGCGTPRHPALTPVRRSCSSAGRGRLLTMPQGVGSALSVLTRLLAARQTRLAGYRAKGAAAWQPSRSRTSIPRTRHARSRAMATPGRQHCRPGCRSWRLRAGVALDDNVKPIAGTDSCQVSHLGYIISGRMKVSPTTAQLARSVLAMLCASSWP